MPLEIRAECRLPLDEAVPETAVRRIAETTAWLLALEKTADTVPARSVIRIAADSAIGRQALVSAVCASTASATRRKQRLHVQVRLILPQNQSSHGRLPREQELLHLLAELIRTKRTKAAEGQELLESLPGNASRTERIVLLAEQLAALEELGRLLPQRESGRWRDPQAALVALRRAAELDPDMALLQHLLGETLVQLDRPQDALAALDRALALEPERAGALYARGLVNLRLQLPSLAEHDLSAALARDGSQAAWWRARGALYMIRNELGKMCNDFLQACVRGDCEGLALARARADCPAGP